MPVYPPNGQDVAAFLGQPDDAALVALADQHVEVVQAMALAYTRGIGVDPATGWLYADLAAVVTTATARLVANPEQLAYQVGSTEFRGGFAGWSLAETFVLNRYRKRAA